VRRQDARDIGLAPVVMARGFATQIARITKAADLALAGKAITPGGGYADVNLVALEQRIKCLRSVFARLTKEDHTMNLSPERRRAVTLQRDRDRAADEGQRVDGVTDAAPVTPRPRSLLIDHVTKAANAGSNYSRGSGDKLAAVQAQWYVDRVSPFSEIEAGEIELTRWKARSGGLLRSHRFEVGDGEGKLTFRRLDADESPESKIDRKIIETLRANLGVLFSQRAVEKAVEGTATDVRDRLKALADDPQRPVRADHSGQHVRYAYDPEADHEPAQPLPL
jgi:hypothetical protein